MSDFNNFLNLATVAFTGLTVEATISATANGLRLPVLRYELTVSGRGLTQAIATTAATEAAALAEARRRVAINKRLCATQQVMHQFCFEWSADELADAKHKMLCARSYDAFTEVAQAALLLDAKKRQQVAA